MRFGLSAGVLAVLVAGLMCTVAWARPTPDTSFAATAQATADQYASPNAGAGPTNQGQTRCPVVVENGQLVRICDTTRQVLGPASTPLATARRGLPFTGLDLTAILLLGASLVTGGVVLRTAIRSRKRRPAA